MTKPIIIVGAGGHAKVLIDALRAAGKTLIGLTDQDAARKGLRVLGLEILGGDEVLAAYPPQEILLVNAVGAARSMTARRNVFARLASQGYVFACVVHPSAVVAADVAAQAGAQILAGAVVGPGVAIGEDAIVNTRAGVDHDCRIGAHAQIAPGVTLCGGVTVGAQSLVGAGATVVPGVRIGRGCLVGAGATVVRDVADHQTVMGVPARPVS